jgi:hypothetical protein
LFIRFFSLNINLYIHTTFIHTTFILYSYIDEVSFCHFHLHPLHFHFHRLFSHLLFISKHWFFFLSLCPPPPRSCSYPSPPPQCGRSVWPVWGPVWLPWNIFHRNRPGPPPLSWFLSRSLHIFLL